MIFKRHKTVDVQALADRVATARAQGGDPRALLLDLTRRIGEEMGVSGCDVYRYLPEAGNLRAEATWPPGDEAAGSWVGTVYPLSEWPSLAKLIGSPQPSQERTDRPGLAERERRDLIGWGVGVTMGARLENGPAVIGCLVVNEDRPRDFSYEELETLRRCAVPVAAALDWAASRDPGR